MTNRVALLTASVLLFAGLGAGLYAEMDEAASARPPTEAFAPSLDPAKRAAGYRRWREAVDRVRSRP